MEYEIRNNTEAKRFEMAVEGKIALVAYSLFEGGIQFLHTEVPPELQGRGLAAILAKHVLDYADANHLKTVVTCPYITTYLKKHPR